MLVLHFAWWMLRDEKEEEERREDFGLVLCFLDVERGKGKSFTFYLITLLSLSLIYKSSEMHLKVYTKDDNRMHTYTPPSASSFCLLKHTQTYVQPPRKPEAPDPPKNDNNNK